MITRILRTKIPRNFAQNVGKSTIKMQEIQLQPMITTLTETPLSGISVNHIAVHLFLAINRTYMQLISLM